MTVSGLAFVDALERRRFDCFAGVPCSMIEDAIATVGPRHFVHVVFDNEVHGSTARGMTLVTDREWVRLGLHVVERSGP